MRIRPQLVLMMSAVMAPVALLAGASIFALGQAQREVHAQRYQERVGALRLALDNEIQATTRVLEGLAFDGGVADAAAQPGPEPRATLQRLLRSFPLWTAVGVLDADGHELVAARRAGSAAALDVDAATLAQARDARASVVSDLVAAPGGRALHTFVVTPVVRDGRVVRAVVASMDDQAWLAFLRGYPVTPDTTLTLLDRQGRIVARTINHAQWVGTAAPASFWQRAASGPQGSFEHEGLEGQRFHVAYSRLRSSGWVLGTGVPAQAVEAALQLPALLTAGGLALTMLLALGIALLVGRRIIDSLEPLAALAHCGGQAPPTPTPLPIREAEVVRRTLGQALADQATALAQAQQLARAKDEFMAMLAHELRNPLAAMRSATALLGMPRATPEAQQRAREVLDRQVGHMVHMVNELLDAARLSGGQVSLELRPLDLALAVRRVLQAFDAAGRTARLRVHTELQSVHVRADETRLEQIVSNLVDNAAKYARPGGTLCIRLREQQGLAELEFADDGSGLSAELLPHLFEPFSQGERRIDRAQGGLGLGLHVVKRLVELHGGSVHARSEGVNRGATFTVRLPAEPAGAQAADAALAAPRLAPLRVALVEDHRDVADMTGALLRLAGHEVACATSGDAALALVPQHRADVALLDLGLPGMDGLELARRLRALDGMGRVLLIALTGYGDARTREAAAAAGFDAFIQKPLDLRGFEAAVLQARGGAGPGAAPASAPEAGRMA